jgi:hypothetical protein
VGTIAIIGSITKIIPLLIIAVWRTHLDAAGAALRRVAAAKIPVVTIFIAHSFAFQTTQA